MRVLLFLIAFLQCGCSSYIYRAYYTNKSDSAIRGYPTIDPPEGFTGVWTHYKWNGKVLANVSYISGEPTGTSFWYKDDGKPYLIRQYEDGKFEKDYYMEPLPKSRPNIPFWFPARYLNRSVAFSLKEGRSR